MEEQIKMVVDEVKKLVRRMDSQENILNLVHKDRDLLEEISIRIGKVEDEIRYLKEKVDSTEKTNRADNKDILKEVQSVGDNVSEVVKTISNE